MQGLFAGGVGSSKRTTIGGPISTETRVNERIRVPEVRLIGPGGEQVGIVRIEDALRVAVDADLDKILLINGVEDHVHLLAGIRPVQSISDLMEKVKGDSSTWLNHRQFLPVHFNWQGGYGAFALSKAHIDRVYKYILNQEEHHRKKTFREEYIDLLIENGIQFDEKYIFKDPE